MKFFQNFNNNLKNSIEICNKIQHRCRDQGPGRDMRTRFQEALKELLCFVNLYAVLILFQLMKKKGNEKVFC